MPILSNLINVVRPEGRVRVPARALPRVSSFDTDAREEGILDAGMQPELPLPIPETMFAQLILDADYAVEKKRLASDYIHVSALKDICPRQYALMVTAGEFQTERITSAERIVWAIGRAVENHVRDAFIKSVNYEGVYGQWRCRCHSTSVRGLYTGATCAVCGTETNRYAELPLFDHDNKVVGNPDLIYFRDGYYHVLEIKSVKVGDSTSTKYKGFHQLDTPLGDHVFQASMYRYLLNKNGLPAAPEVSVLYVAKDYTKKGPPIKEFKVDVSVPEYEGIIQIALRNARSVFGFLEGGEVLPDGVCKAMSDTRANNCPVVGRCFG